MAAKEATELELRPAYIGFAYTGTLETFEDEKFEKAFTVEKPILTCPLANLKLEEGSGLTVAAGKITIKLTEAQTQAVGQTLKTHYYVREGEYLILHGEWNFKEP